MYRIGTYDEFYPYLADPTEAGPHVYMLHVYNILNIFCNCNFFFFFFFFFFIKNKTLKPCDACTGCALDDDIVHLFFYFFAITAVFFLPPLPLPIKSIISTSSSSDSSSLSSCCRSISDKIVKSNFLVLISPANNVWS